MQRRKDFVYIMEILLSAYEKTTHQLMFRVYAEPLPDTGRRQSHRAAHFAALDLLGAALAEDFGVYHAVIRRSGLGKPQLIHDFLHMNLSHCRGLAVAAAGRMPLGVDAEAPRSVPDSLLEKVCTPAEIAAISADEDKNRAFSRFWTLKEAYAKWDGRGLAIGFASLGFTLSDPITFHHPAEAVRFVQLPYSDSHIVSLCYPSGSALCLTT